MTREEVEKLINTLAREYNVDGKTILHYFYKIGRPGIHLIEWPTGSGKSLLISFLASLYPLTGNLKCFIFCRTYTQINEYLNRISEISSILGVDHKVSLLVGKEMACPYGDIYNREMSYLFCSYLGNGSRCRDFKNMSHIDPAHIADEISNAKDMESMIEHFIDEGLCPYYSLRKLGENSDLTLSTYYYLFKGPLPGERRPFRYCVFIDEGHNLLEHFINSNLISLNKDALTSISRKIDITKEANAFLKALSKSDNDVDKFNKERLISFLKKMKQRILESYFNQFQKGIQKINTFDTIEIEMINKLFSVNLNTVFYVSHDDDSIRLYVMPRFSYIKNFLNSSYSTVIASATLSPTDFFFLFYRSLGINKDIKKYDAPYLIDSVSSVQLNVYISNRVTSRYEARTPESFFFISDFTLKVMEKTKYSTILFVPSVEIGEIVYSILKESVSSRNVDDLEVFIGHDPDDVISFLRENKLSILILSQRGRYAEGINSFRTSDKSFNIIVYGLSIQPDDPLKNALFSKLFGLSSKDIFLYGYIMPAMIFFIQSIGRVINRNRKVNIFILEKRILRYLNSDITPKWFRKLIENHKILSMEFI